MKPSKQAVALAASWRLGTPRPEKVSKSFGRQWQILLMCIEVPGLDGASQISWVVYLRSLDPSFKGGPNLAARQRKERALKALLGKHGVTSRHFLVNQSSLLLEEVEAAELFLKVFDGIYEQLSL